MDTDNDFVLYDYWVQLNTTYNAAMHHDELYFDSL